MENEIEIWKDVPNYEGLYQVSSFGRVKSRARQNTKGGILRAAKSSGYLLVVLCKNGEEKTFKVHQLVAMAFLGHNPCRYRIVVDHIDNNPINNHVYNLNLVSARENTNKDRKGGTSKYTGVSWSVERCKWTALIHFKNRYVYLGLFDLEIDAANAYQKALKELEQGLDLNIIYPKHVKTSQYKGINWDKSKGKWQARYGRKQIGRFNTELEAYEAREKYILQLQEKVLDLK